MASGPKQDQYTVDLCLRLIALAPCCMVEKCPCNRVLLIELPKQVNIRRCGFHSRLSGQTLILTGMGGAGHYGS